MIEMKTLLKNAKILKMNGEKIFTSNIVIDENRIAYIGNDFDQFGPFDVVRDIKNNLIMPGFKNPHTHSAMTFLRSKVDDLPLQEWLFDNIIPRENHLTEDDVYIFTKLAILEYLSSGITGCLEQYYFPASIKKAFEEYGFRSAILLAYEENGPYTSETIKKWINESRNQKDPLVTYVLGCHSEYLSTPGQLKVIHSLLEETKLPFFFHVSETEKEVNECFEKRGISPVEYMEENNMFINGGGGFHCVHFEPEDINIFKKNNLTIVSCPGSNCKLGSGIAPLNVYLKAGVNIALATDGPASNNSLDMFKEMTLAYSLQKAVSQDPTALPAYEVLKMATVNGARAMLLDDCDIIEVGKKADLIEIDLTNPNMQPINNIESNIVFSGSKDNILMTMIDGKILYADKKFYINDDIEALFKEVEIRKNIIDKKAGF